MDLSEEEEEEIFAGVSRPVLNATGGGADSEAEDEDEGAAPAAADDSARSESGEDSALLGAEAAFGGLDSAGIADEMDPFRTAGPVASADPEPSAAGASKSAGKKQKWLPENHVVHRKVFIGGLGFDVDDSALLKFFSRFGKVQEASVARTDKGKPRGFGFVTFVNHKGAKFCVKEAGEEGKMSVLGREVGVRMSENRGADTPHYMMPARGQYDPRPARSNEPQRAPGGSGAGKGAKRVADDWELIAPSAEERGEGAEGGAEGKRKRKRPEQIVTVTRRQDAEPLYDKAITMKELFPKEFWRI